MRDPQESESLTHFERQLHRAEPFILIQENNVRRTETFFGKAPVSDNNPQAFIYLLLNYTCMAGIGKNVGELKKVVVNLTFLFN